MHNKSSKEAIGNDTDFSSLLSDSSEYNIDTTAISPEELEAMLGSIPLYPDEPPQNNANSNNNNYTKEFNNPAPKPARRAITLLGDEVPENLLDKIEWSCNESNIQRHGLLTILDKDNQPIKQRVFTPTQWNYYVKLVYPDQYPMKPLEKKNYPKDENQYRQYTKERRFITVNTYKKREIEEEAIFGSINKPCLDLDSPLLDPNNKSNLTNNGKDITAVFKESGQLIPENTKVIWTKVTRDKKDSIGFIEIENQKYLVTPITGWNKRKAWTTPEGRKIDRAEYDQLVRKGNTFFLKTQNDTTEEPIPLVHAYLHKRKARANSEPKNKHIQIEQSSETNEQTISERPSKKQKQSKPKSPHSNFGLFAPDQTQNHINQQLNEQISVTHSAEEMVQTNINTSPLHNTTNQPWTYLSEGLTNAYLLGLKTTFSLKHHLQLQLLRQQANLLEERQMILQQPLPNDVRFHYANEKSAQIIQLAIEREELRNGCQSLLNLRKL